MADELKPCPFCGREVNRDDRTEYEHYSARDAQQSGLGYSGGSMAHVTYAIQCECGIRVQGNNDDFLVARWNRRHQPNGGAGVACTKCDGTREVYDSDGVGPYHCPACEPHRFTSAGGGDARDAAPSGWISDNDLLKLQASVEDARNIRMSTRRTHLRVHPVYIRALAAMSDHNKGKV